ncbi:MAG: preprotein translocase subunit SecE [Dehalococcoidia bacterium]|nr:Protein translocase subunit SecE [Chloroflexota bacterium]MBT9159103.1 Protein translocase subunit SecE [Chloroflexota bacterium]MBT9161496.1 Protein translocase subunit SecE [Chloroflexota bacterium]
MKRRVEAKREKPGFRFVRSIVAELRKVVWPSRQETIRLTVIVLIVTVVIAMMLGVIDLAFAELVEILIIR